MTTVGWIFDRGDDVVWVCLADEAEARKRAIVELGGEPEGDTMGISSDLAKFLRLGVGGVAKGRIIERGKS